jgi:hypothetical protein
LITSVNLKLLIMQFSPAFCHFIYSINISSTYCSCAPSLFSPVCENVTTQITKQATSFYNRQAEYPYERTVLEYHTYMYITTMKTRCQEGALENNMYYNMYWTFL